MNWALPGDGRQRKQKRRWFDCVAHDMQTVQVLELWAKTSTTGVLEEDGVCYSDPARKWKLLAEEEVMRCLSNADTG